jgi:glycosyltransferase involved in cell wall biosynthesis
LKVLIINDYSTPTGGAEVYSLNLRTALRQYGHDARFFASSVGSKNLRMADYECWGTSQKVMNRLLQTYNPVAAFQIRKRLKEFCPDIVHLNIFLTQLSPSILPVLREFPVVYTAHWYRAICPKGTKLIRDHTVCTYPAGVACWWLDMLQLRLLKRHFRNIDFVIANSRITEERLGVEGIHCDSRLPYFVNSSALEEKKFSPQPTICFLGRLVPEKGADVLIRAMKTLLQRLPDARLLIAGNGPQKGLLEQLVSQLGLGASIHFLGYIPNENLDSLWAECDVLAVPSRWEEPFGIVATEALAAGVPVVATRGGGLEEIVEDQKSGYYVEPGNVEELSDKLYDVLRDRKLAIQLGQYGKQMMQAKFNMKSHLDQLMMFYERLLQVRKKNDRKGVSAMIATG